MDFQFPERNEVAGASRSHYVLRPFQAEPPLEARGCVSQAADLQEWSSSPFLEKFNGPALAVSLRRHLGGLNHFEGLLEAVQYRQACGSVNDGRPLSLVFGPGRAQALGGVERLQGTAVIARLVLQDRIRDL